MIALGLLGIFLVFALLMFTRRMPALLALPAMAILIGVLAQVPLPDLLNVVIAQGAVKLAAVYVAVFAGAMMGRVLMQTGVAEEIIKRAAEYGGERPLVVSLGLLLVTAILFTTLQGLGAIITVGSLVLPIMMSLGIPRKMAGTLFLLAFSTGFIFNPILFTLYRQLLQLKEEQALPAELASFALVLLVLMVILVLGYAFWAAKRSGEILLMKAESKPSDRIPYATKSKVPFIAYFSPIVPLILFFGFNYWGLKLDFIASFILGSLFAVWTTDPKNSIKILSASAIKGVEDGAPAALLMMGIGMLLNALSLPVIKDAMLPLIQALPFQSGLFYIAFFGLLSPLALYRGPLNVFGIGIGIFSIMVGAQVLPAMALIAAVMCVVQMQNTCDPTNTHNVWIANFVGVRVESLTRETIGPIMVLCLIGLVIAAVLYL
jgi:hypothetical protein